MINVFSLYLALDSSLGAGSDIWPVSEQYITQNFSHYNIASHKPFLMSEDFYDVGSRVIDYTGRVLSKAADVIGSKEG